MELKSELKGMVGLLGVAMDENKFEGDSSIISESLLGPKNWLNGLFDLLGLTMDEIGI
jgi:hypothetical protein